ncbi:MAG TPA: 1-acyl-sn-glycerol-3-phosphate acyltransferase [Polyangiaceae bacterium]|nr:1-acyl-sn-glycerol-3-phosphate acyltransferase [Polyangiaceae bacterium]
MDRPLVSYEPNALLAWVYRRFFESIEVDEAWARAVREADARGTVVYVLRSLSFVDFLALDYLTKRHHLPQIRFANDLGLWILEPMGRGWLNALRPRTAESDVADLERAVKGGSSAALFLKRPPHLLEGRGRGRIEGDHLIRALIDVQREREERILLVPQVFVWSRSAGTLGAGFVDSLFGPSEWPGQARSIAQFMANWRHATLRAGEPVDLQEFLARESDGAADDVVVRRLTYTLLRRLERERRAIVGSARKPADRLREEVIRSPKLQKVITDMAGEGARERTVITARALSMVREMEASLDVNAIAALAPVFEQASSRMFSAIEVDQPGIERLREHAKEGTLILLPSHKSHVDYLALAWVLYEHKLQLPLVAAGDNLNFFPMGPIFRRAGAFFIRRSFAGDRLYAAVVDAYMRRLIKDGQSLEFFLEGGRSRTGKLLSPKLGLLSIVVDAALGAPTRTAWFCPVSIGYERFVEEKAFVHELSGGEKAKEDVRGLVKSIDVVVGRYGHLSVQFGKPMTLADVLRELDPKAKPADLATMTPARRRAVVTRLAYRVMNEINAVTAVTPGSLVATAMLAHDKRGMPHAELEATCERLARLLRRAGARFSPSVAGADGKIRPSALREAVDLFVKAGHVQAHRVEGDPIYVVPPEGRMSLDLAKNVMLHFFVPRAVIATALLAPPGPPQSVDALRERVLALSRLFKYEFTFRADAPFETIFDEEIAAMEVDGELARVVRRPSEGAGALLPKGDDGAEQLALYARLLENFVEGYRVAARGLAALQRGALSTKELVKRAIPEGERMFLAGDIARRESVSRPMLENAYQSFVDQGYVARSGGKLALTESYARASAVETIEARIAGFAVPRRT